jgi:hypothetical protein
MKENKRQLNLIGGGFQHTQSSSGVENKYVEWVKGSISSDISIYVDEALLRPSVQGTKNYGWLCESKTIIPEIYNWCENNLKFLKNNFIKVFTHDVELVAKSEIFVLTQCSIKSVLPENNHNLYLKNKLVSMIASNKVMCPEHKFRQHIISKFKNKCDLYGRGYNQIDSKLSGLQDYCFSFAMENATYSNMITEKITDCFVTGTIPIYYGIKNIGDFFNIDGIIMLDGNFDINSLSFDLYEKMYPAVLENYQIAKNILTAEDYIYKKFLQNKIYEN